MHCESSKTVICSFIFWEIAWMFNWKVSVHCGVTLLELQEWLRAICVFQPHIPKEAKFLKRISHTMHQKTYMAYTVSTALSKRFSNNKYNVSKKQEKLIIKIQVIYEKCRRLCSHGLPLVLGYELTKESWPGPPYQSHITQCRARDYCKGK